MNYWRQNCKRQAFLIFFCIIGFILFGHTDSASATSSLVYVARLNDDTINPVTAAYLEEAIDKAEQVGAECLIIELDTPGGLLNSMRSIVKHMMASKIPIIVYVYPCGARAGSAGVFITYASHIAAMAPSTNIGAAHPVELGNGPKKEGIGDILRKFLNSQKGRANEKKEGKSVSTPESTKEDMEPMESKILNDTVAFIRSLAQERHRNPKWAELAVTQSQSITEEEALEKGVIEIIAKNERDLLRQLQGRQVKVEDSVVILQTKGAVIRYIPMDPRQRILNILANPNIAYILMILGFYGLLYEVTHPGFGVPGVMGLIFLILAFFSMQTLPTNYAGLALIILSLVLFIAEAMVPGFGLLTLGGVVSMILGSLMLFNSPEPIMTVSLIIILPFTAATALITIFLVRLVIKAHRKRIHGGMEGMVGERGTAKTVLIPNKEGKVFVHGELWNAVANEEIHKGEKIEVVKVDGMTLVVQRKQNP